MPKQPTHARAGLNIIAGVISGMVAAVLVAAPVRADDQSYLTYLESHHVNTLWLSPQDKTSTGHMICSWLRGGMSPGDIAQQIKVADGAGIVDAAQHELCPDTLH
jgi:hypothetical protein